MKRYNYLGALALGALGACSNAGPADPNGVTIKVAPLDLPGVTDASYTITVKQGAETVWSESSITADQYGNGKGDITYIGTCDADDGIPEEGPATATNTVELVLESLNGGAITEFQNPCPATKPCTQEILCTENADAQVTFNITIMRDANQGFFDIAVNFQDLFCSAKFDCEYEDGTPIHLLFDGSDRAATAVLAFACTSGDGGSATNLYLNDIHVDCSTEDSSVLEVAPDELGNQNDSGGSAPIFDYAVYAGAEQLEGYNKGYWNVALGFDTSWFTNGRTCTVSTRGTASETALGEDTTPKNTAYPVVDFAVRIGVTNGELNCGAHPLNGEGSGVTTQYSDVTDLGECFDNAGTVSSSTISLSNDDACPNPLP